MIGQTPGQTLGQYRILDRLGAGGMGEVYRAHDSRLQRDVAIKLLPATLSRDPERLARFEQEARHLAALNHPNIASIYGLEEAGGTRFLVLELVPGETLAERIGRGKLPIAEALALFLQIAEALEAAHERGIIHRDLKPANVKVTPDGKVKVLDFGLAKAFAPGAASGGPDRPEDLSQSPTATYGATREGVILGTAAYMSPEQARGKPVDRRTDIWSFGCVLYEALAGKQAFFGETVSDTMAKILEREPDWTALPDGMPGSVRTLLRRCLRKDARRRLHDVADLRIEIEEVLAGGAEAGGTDRVEKRGLGISWRVAIVLAVLIAAAAGVLAWRMAPVRGAAPGPVTWLQIELPPEAPLDPEPAAPFALSPDGTKLIYVGKAPEGSRLFLRALDQPAVTPLPGTEGAENPFFSPDGMWVGFFAAGSVKKVSLAGGAPVTLHEAERQAGGAWGTDRRIYFVSRKRPVLLSMSEDGGEAGVPNASDLKGWRRELYWPHPLPDGRGLLYNVRPSISLEPGIAILPAGAAEERILVERCGRPIFLASGYLLCASYGRLIAAAFDPVRLELIGPAVSTLEDVATVPASLAAMYSLSATGTLAYVRGPAGGVQRTLLQVNRQGVARPLIEGRHLYHVPRFSPDGRRLAVNIADEERDIWILDLERTALTRLTFEGPADRPVWAADGRRIIYRVEREGRTGIWWRPLESGGAAEPLLEAEQFLSPESTSADGRFLAFIQRDDDTGNDIWILPLTGERKPFPFVKSPYSETSASFSPDGRWISYTSNESGRIEIYVQPFPGPGAKVQVSTGGGGLSTWASGGREIIYRQQYKIMAASVITQPTLRISKPQMLFEYKYPFVGGSNYAYDVTPDGQRFVMLKSDIESPPTRIEVILNWTEELKRRVPAGKE